MGAERSSRAGSSPPVGTLFLRPTRDCRSMTRSALTGPVQTGTVAAGRSVTGGPRYLVSITFKNYCG